MQWYYSIRGRSEERGIATWDELHELALKKILKRDDIVWPRPDGTTWVAAASVDRLFNDVAEPEPVSAVQPAGQPVQPAASRPQEEARPEKAAPSLPRERKAVPVAVVLLGWIAGLAVALVVAWGVYTGVIGGGTLEDSSGTGASVLPDGELLIPVKHGPAPDELLARVQNYLAQNRLAEAERDLLVLRNSSGFEQEVAGLQKQLAKRKKQLSRRNELTLALQGGGLGEEAAAELFAYFESSGDLKELYLIADRLLAKEGASNPAISLSLAHLYSLGKRKREMVKSLQLFQKMLGPSLSGEQVRSASRLFRSADEASTAEALLVTFVNKWPAARMQYVVYAELGAIFASSGRDKDALVYLEKAVMQGGASARTLIGADARFTALRESRAYRKLMPEG